MNKKMREIKAEMDVLNKEANKLFEAKDYEGAESSDGKDIRGFGNSLRCTDYVIRVIKNNPELKDRDIYVVGHSWGGFAASNIAGIYKDIKGVVPLSPVIGVSRTHSSL